MGSLFLVQGWFEAKNSTDPSPFSETAEPIKLKFTIPINTTPIEMKFCEKLPFGLYVVDKYIKQRWNLKLSESLKKSLFVQL